ncbi:MAG TPA: PmoA family protein [Candidatus Limnocylindrales bacterium]
MLRLINSSDALSVHYGQQELFTYVYQPDTPQLESPRPYFHPVRTLAGQEVTLFRPEDHVWHKGIAWSLPNVGTENFWGGVTYLRDRGYVQLPNNGAQVHEDFLRLSPATVAHRLHWVTEGGDVWFREVRRFDVSVYPQQGAWVLAFGTAMTNVSGGEIVIGSPTTEGRENAGYGGLFWRGPLPFVGGKVYSPDAEGGDDLMGVRGPWMGFTSGEATLVFTDAQENPDHPTKWFVRNGIYACLCPAPFFDTPIRVADGESLLFRYAVVIADGDPGRTGAANLAHLGQSAMSDPQWIPAPPIRVRREPVDGGVSARR